MKKMKILAMPHSEAFITNENIIQKLKRPSPVVLDAINKVKKAEEQRVNQLQASYRKKKTNRHKSG